jgi:diguanylate cyclase (GGDEF)-like protein
MCVSSEENRESMLPGLYVRARELDILADDLIALANQVVSGWQEWSVILEVKVPAGFSFTDLQERANHAARPAAPALSMLCLPEALRILLVGADMAERLRLEQQLSAAGHVVVSAGNGQEALAHVLDMAPQLVITECELPVMDGLAFCRSLRLSKIGRQVYVIALGTEKGEQGQLDAITAGADDYLVKPLTIETLAARLRAAQRVVQLQQEVYRDREEIHRYAAELETANSRLQQAAQTDSLTGLYNRRHLMEQLSQLWEESRQTNLPLGFLMADLDDFKRVNDTQGHDVGDLFLQETAAVLWGAARRTDVVCRFGGEEFAVLCPNTALAGAELFAERLRARIENHVVLTKGKSLRVTLSVGVACKHGGMNVADDLLRAADQALYAAKQAGRNCVYVSEVVSPKATATVRPAAAQAGVLRIVS